ncbi:MAG TPA: FAD-dependent oxidoreductase [Thermoguttaceae bacterium]|nr:FAD-dependent oxidoreductase [Thermoguttaceae bacterium]
MTTRRATTAFGLILIIMCASSAAKGATVTSDATHATVLVEAEGFDEHGGWVVDQQAIDQMGSAYLLAHGLGVPVDDAVATVRFPARGTYRVMVRTRDWVAPWKAPGAPGKFRVVVDGQALPTVFGTEGAEWHWQDGGTVRIAKQEVRIALHDLTGFAGRCDAVLFTTDPDFTPPNDGPALAAFRRKALGLGDGPEEAGEFDLVVVGGGIAGTCAAISAARLGVRVALVQNRPLLGGNNSSDVRVGLSGQIHQAPYPALGDVVEEIAPIGYYDFREAEKYPDRPESQRILKMDPVKRVHNAGPASNYQDQKKLRAVKAEKNIHLFLNTHVFRAEKQGDRIVAVVGKHIESGREMRLRAPLFADCTGDGNLGHLAGADYRVGRESRDETGEPLAPEKPDQLVMGTSVQWYTVEEPKPQPFPDCPWAVQFDEETYQRVTRGDWDWETGMNRDQIAEIEAIRDHALRVVYGNWAFLKNHSPEKDEIANRRLAWVAYVGGKRESRRLLGDVILRQQDLEEERAFPDASVTTTWGIDLHYPAPENIKHFPGQEFRSIAKSKRIKPYPIPYRCFYSRNVENLLMAGRNISVTHVALGTVRVQKTTGMMGEVVGMAGWLATKHKTGPRGVYQNHLDELKDLMRRGVGKKEPSSGAAH